MMKKEILNGLDWYLIQAILLGEQTESEAEKFNAWIEVNENAILFEQIKAVWHHDFQKTEYYDIDTERALSKVKVQLAPTGKTKSRHYKNWIFKIAASVLILISISYLFVLNENSLENELIEIETGSKNNETVILPDGSKIFLNVNSKLFYPEEFDKSHRTIELIGEAFFEVKPILDRPFIVKANKTITQVVGTSFNLKTNDSNDVELVVATGKVWFSTQNENEKVILTKGDKANYFQNIKSLYKSKNKDSNYDSWRTHVLVFNDQSLEEVFQLLSNVYNEKIVIMDPELINCTLSARFNNSSLEDVESAISEIFNLRIIRDVNEHKIYGNGCK